MALDLVMIKHEALILERYHLIFQLKQGKILFDSIDIDFYIAQLYSSLVSHGKLLLLSQ